LNESYLYLNIFICKWFYHFNNTVKVRINCGS